MIQLLLFIVCSCAVLMDKTQMDTVPSSSDNYSDQDEGKPLFINASAAQTKNGKTGGAK